MLLAYLLAVSMTDEVNLSIGPLQKLVDYQYDFNFTEMIPGLRYEASVNASWAIPASALAGLDGQRITVRISAEAANGSGISFPSAFGALSNQTEAHIYCDVANGTCANSSVLSAVIPLSIVASINGSGPATISLRSEIVEGQPALSAPDLQKPASDLLEAFRKTFAGASAQNATAQPGSGLFPNASSNNSSENFLDTLRPEGDSKNPLDYLRQNPLISIAALAIVVVITGAYLLNAKD